MNEWMIDWRNDWLIMWLIKYVNECIPGFLNQAKIKYACYYILLSHDRTLVHYSTVSMLRLPQSAKQLNSWQVENIVK